MFEVHIWEKVTGQNSTRARQCPTSKAVVVPAMAHAHRNVSGRAGVGASEAFRWGRKLTHSAGHVPSLPDCPIDLGEKSTCFENF